MTLVILQRIRVLAEQLHGKASQELSFLCSVHVFRNTKLRPRRQHD